MKKKSAVLVPAAPVIGRLVARLGYTRVHVANVLRAHAPALGARKRVRRWMMPEASVALFEKLIKSTSGRRYKLGERGPH